MQKKDEVAHDFDFQYKFLVNNLVREGIANFLIFRHIYSNLKCI